MKKKDIILKVAEKTSLTLVQSTMVVDAVFDSISEALCEDDKLTIRGFGTFYVQEREARLMYVPGSDTVRELPKVKRVNFKSADHLKDMINKD